MDPYIKFTMGNRLLYCTQKLQQAGCSPVWKNDQFATLLPSDSLHTAIYDDDLIGKDDFLGECTLTIPEVKTKAIEGVLSKQNYKESPGNIIVEG